MKSTSLLATLVGLALVAAVLLSVPLVSAHSRPVRFDPAPGAVLNTAPARVDGWFTSDIRRDPNWSFIHVADADGNRVDIGDPVLSTDRRQMSANLRSGLGSGRYVVTWRTWDDSDGEIFGDCFTFYVGQAAADAAINDRFRLDAGSRCERFEVGTEEGTPSPEKVSALATATVLGDSAPDNEATASDDSGGGDVPVWLLLVGVGAGILVGGVGGRFLGRSHG